jgi:hypothetical protein
LQANRTPEAAAELPGEVSFTRPRDRNKETIAQGTFVGGLTGPALRQVRKHAAIIAWMRSTMSPTSRVRLMQDTKRSKKSQVAGEATARAAKTRSGRQEKPACPHALKGAKAGLVDTSSESDTSDAGGMPQLFRRPMAPSAYSPKVPRVVSRRQTAAQRSTLELTVAREPRRKARKPPLLTRRGHKIRQGGVAHAGAILRIAREAGEENKGGVRRGHQGSRRATNSRGQSEPEVRTVARTRNKSCPGGSRDRQGESAGTRPASGRERRIRPRLGQHNERHRKPGYQGFWAIGEQRGMAVFQRSERGVPSIQGKMPALPGDLPQGNPPRRRW